MSEQPKMMNYLEWCVLRGRMTQAELDKFNKDCETAEEVDFDKL